MKFGKSLIVMYSRFHMVSTMGKNIFGEKGEVLNNKSKKEEKRRICGAKSGDFWGLGAAPIFSAKKCEKKEKKLLKFFQLYSKMG